MGKNLNDELIGAAEVGDSEDAKRLLETGADVNARDEGGWTPLMCAVYEEHFACVQTLISAGANVNAQQKTSGETALMLAVGNGHLEYVQALISAGASLDTQEDNEGTTALIMATMSGNLDCVEALISAGADVCAEGYDGKTAKRIAEEEDHEDIIDFFRTIRVLM